MRRGEIRYADLGKPYERRPALVVTTSDLIAGLNSVMCAALTTTLRGIPSRLAVGTHEGLKQASEAICDQLLLVEKANIDTVPLGSLGPVRFPELDKVLAYALGIRKENLA